MKKQVLASYTPEDMQYEGLAAVPEVWEDGLRTDPAPSFFEWWYFDSHFDDGSTAVIVFYTKSMLNRQVNLQPSVSITITRPDGKKLTGFKFYSPEDFQASKEMCDVRINQQWVKGDLQTYSLHVDAGELGADLQMQAVVPAWRPGAGKNYYDAGRKDFFAWLAAVPYGTLSGSLRYDGVEHGAKGTFYHDHNWGNVGIEKTLSHWYWGRAHVDDYTLIFVEMTAARKFDHQKLPVFMLAKGSEILVGDGRPLQMVAFDFTRHSGGREFPQSVRFDWHSGQGAVSIHLGGLQEIEATSLLGALPRWKQSLARLVGANPFYFRFNAAMQLSVDLPAVQTQQQGSALYEIMLLQ